MGYRISRRGLLNGAAGVAAAGTLAGCAMGGDDDTESDAKGEVSAANPLGVKEDAPLEVVIFNGGFGEEYAKAHEAMYQERYPKAEIKHSSTQKIAETLQPRFVAGDPPDVVNNSGGSQIDFNGLVSQGALTDLGELLDAPSLDDPAKKVRDTLLPGIVDVGSYDGKFLSLNYAYSAYGVWYSRKLFESKGWQYPKTWDEMIALCKKIKAAGIAPWTYPGKHSRYMSWPILAAAGKLGGIEVIKAIDNLEPNAWKHEAVRAAAEAYYQLAVDGFLQPGAEGMDHVQSQTEWCRGHAAFVSCGSWLENEQKSVTPPDFRMAVAPTPSLTTSDKMPFEAFRGTGSEPFIVPTKGKNVRGGLEYLRVMLSQQGASDFTRKVSSLTCVKGAGAGIELGPGLASVTGLIEASKGTAFTWLYSSYYRKLERERVDAACAELYTKRINAAQWCEQVQKSADEFAQDPAVKKYKRA
ncbi:N-acetylglucosamine/diacetylchitobiose ABC transporter substrate-binding protein [Amorphoplanes digitatis]|uniref:N-acetylglucosamine transport system substrate-binding protein n=1 Tax=Actinoplanes digitatis TaxID=1868 RepID=A0A7W7I105_9ACTN|nr:N-acetylglucosamine/diacetylchitobiose ABC transporter substrate-binding protein [Actinoplanes digitatis]MBB4764395.1 N-acetylglucosamine transport system substrate-binding protein [Actinoplanes digitatis]GID94118.1 carbohydrate ABC transporter, N-acetylglucosamine/diacetylchitobiose-binding protein [Actinoplanes digitatis]